MGGPVLNLRAEPQLAAPLAEVDDWARHLGVPALVQAHIARVRQAKDLGNATSVDQVGSIDKRGHEPEGTARSGSVRPNP